jgi:DNA-binding IclR family transcriptional regulator
VTSVERAIAILELLDSSRRGMNVSEISRKLKLPKSSTHAIILTLARKNYVIRHLPDQRYTLALKVYNLGREMLLGLELSEMALEPMKWLVKRSHFTAHLAVLEKKQAVYIQKVTGPGLVQFDTFIGKRTNLHCTAVGKVLLAYSPELASDRFFSKSTLARHTERTITSVSTLRMALNKVRDTGFALEDQEEEIGVRCLAVPIFNHGEFLAALSITGIVNQLPLENVDALVLLAKKAAGRIYGQYDDPTRRS